MDSIENITNEVTQVCAPLDSLELDDAAITLLGAAGAIEIASGGDSEALDEVAEFFYAGSERISAAAAAIAQALEKLGDYLDVIGALPVEVNTTASSEPLPVLERDVEPEPGPDEGDQPIDRAAVAAAYPPEMCAARDDLTQHMTRLRQTLAARDIAGDLPPRLTVDDKLPSRTLVTFGALSDDMWEALAQFQEEKALKELDPDQGGTDDLLTIQYTNGPPASAAENELFREDNPRQVLAWVRSEGDVTIEDVLLTYDDGYVEHRTHATRTERYHPDDADEFTIAYAEPSEQREVDVVPYTVRSATPADIAAHRSRLQDMCARYGIMLP